jgi:GH24 family phage-related lysozyme (muramidase)
MNVSTSQLNTTAVNEGFVAHAYKDGFVGGNQMHSIGFGHQIQPGENYLLTATITRDQALKLLQNDSKNVVDYINLHTQGRLPNQGQFDAFFDYGYNAGVGALQANILTPWNSGASTASIADAIKTTRTKYHDTSGNLVVNSTLVSRRAQEASIFLNGHTGVSTLLILFIAICVAYYYCNNEQIPFLA